MKIAPQPPSGNMLPDLFTWALQQPSLPLSLPARRIANRFGLPPRRAELIAELAGFFQGVSHG